FYLDREIGRVMDELKALGIDKNTAVFLVSDNGGSLVTYARNGIYKGGKYTLFEGGTRVPMMANFPKKYSKGAVVAAPASTMDLFPTICALAGAPVPERLDGVDVTAQLTGEKAEIKRSPLFWDTKREWAIRKGKWKLLVTKQVPNAKLQITDTPKGTFLYDLEKDPGETTNLYSQYPEVAGGLASELETWKAAVRQD
uniref:sulfatase family protein n=1 Tax=Pontiella sp. TaxID=2837462 RepID=UPI003564E94A